jgi:hypothetical protein
MTPNEQFARVARAVNIECDGDVIALGYMMRDWLKSSVADGGTSVEQGIGIGYFDLWVKIGGKEIFITIKPTDISDYKKRRSWFSRFFAR